MARPYKALVAGSAVCLLGASSNTVRQSRTAFDRALPAMNGRELQMKVFEVNYAPGQKSAPHAHGCAVAVYVTSGAIRMAVRGGADSVYKKGDVFFEQPTDIHQVGENASATEPATFTATMVCDRTVKPPQVLPPTDAR